MFAPATSPSNSPPSKKTRNGDRSQGQPKRDSDEDALSDEDSDSSSYEDSDSSSDEDSDNSSDEEDNYYSDEDAVEDEEGDEDEEDLVESSPSPNAVLERAKNMVMCLVEERNLFLVPSKDLPKLVDLRKCPQITDRKKDPIIYSVVKQEENGDLTILKLAGATTDGSKRAVYLKNKGIYPPDAIYITLFGLSRLDSTMHDLLLTSIQNLCEDICTIEDEEELKAMTIQDALDSQSGGGDIPDIPFTLNLLAHYIVHRGAFSLRGVLKRFTIHVLESGFQEYARGLGGLSLGEGAEECVQHEFLRGRRHLKRAAKNMRDVANELNNLLATLRQKFGDEYVEYLRSSSIVIKALSSWPPDIYCLGFTVAILDVMFGKDNWKDAFLFPPPTNEKGDAYDKDGYGDEDHAAAQRNMKEFVESMKNSGCVGALDSNECLFGYMGTTAAEYLTNNGWNHVCDLEGFVFKVYSYKGEDWEHPAIIILHGPPCPIMNSDLKVPVDQGWVNKSRTSSRGTTALDEFAKLLRTPDANESFSADMNDHFVLGNIMVMQCMIEYLAVDWHHHRHAVSVIAKDLRVDFNVLCPEHTGLMLKGTPRLTEKEPCQKSDHHLHTKLRNALSQTKKNEQERINNCVEILREQFPDAETKEEKERQDGHQRSLLRRKARKIGLDDRIKKEIKKVWKLERKERIENFMKELETTEKQNENSFAAMVAARVAAATNENEE